MLILKKLQLIYSILVTLKWLKIENGLGKSNSTLWVQNSYIALIITARCLNPF